MINIIQNSSFFWGGVEKYEMGRGTHGVLMMLVKFCFLIWVMGTDCLLYFVILLFLYFKLYVYLYIMSCVYDILPNEKIEKKVYGETFYFSLWSVVTSQKGENKNSPCLMKQGNCPTPHNKV